MGAALNIEIGTTFGRLTIISEVFPSPKHGRRYFNVSCSCGSVSFMVRLDALTRKTTESCGCLQKIAASKANTRHGDYNTSLYHVWEAMKQRCTNPLNPVYHHYGGRGIGVCDDWLIYINFKKWAISSGYDETLELERIDNNDGYYPGNCEWATESSQSYNKRQSPRNSSGKTGVYWDSEREKWKVIIGKDVIGRFSNFEQAVEIRKKLELARYGFNLDH